MSTIINKHTRSRSWWLWGLSFALLGGILLALLKWSAGGVTLTVANSSGGQLTGIRIRFTGGDKPIPNLAPTDSHSCKVNPTAASSLAIEFMEASGARHSNEIDVYFERNYRGTILITIGPNGKVQWKQKITPWPI